MLHNRKLVKSYPKSLFAYHTNRSGDSSNQLEVMNSSSSSDTLSSDIITSSSVNSSTSSLSTSSDNSSEFNEVEKVIEEYFIRKLARNSVTKSLHVNSMNNPTERAYNSNKLIDFQKFKYFKSSAFSFENLFWKNAFISSSEVGTQVCSLDFYVTIRNNRDTLRSKSSNSSNFTGIWTHHKNLKAYLNKPVKDPDLCFLFENSFNVTPRLCKKLRQTEEWIYDNYTDVKQRFVKYFSGLKKVFDLSLSIDHFSPFKSILLLDKYTSKILLFNDKAKLLFKLEDPEVSQYFNRFLVNKIRYANLVDYYFDTKGNICYLPAKMVLCKDSYEYNFYVSLRLQEINHKCLIQSEFDPIIVVIEPLILSFGLCILSNDHIVSFNNGFINMLKLHTMEKDDFDNEKLSKICSSKFHLAACNFSKKIQEIKHNMINFSSQDIPFYFLSILYQISEFEMRRYSSIYRLQTLKTLNVEDEFCANFMWFYSNLSCLLTITLCGKIIDCDPYFTFLVGYSKSELINIDINEIIKFNSFEFDVILLLEKSNGKYDVTLSHLNGTKIKSIVCINKQENNYVACFYTLWFIPDSNDCIFPSPITVKAQLQTEYSVNLNRLLDEFGCSKIDKSETYINKSEVINETKETLSNLKKKKSFSLPERCNYNAYKLLPRSILTTTDIIDGNTSSVSSEHLKENSFAKDLDVFHNDYDILNIIGKGAFGFVRLATSISNNEEFVVKFIRKCKLSIEHMVKVPLKDVNKSERRSKLIYGYETTSADKILMTNDVDKDLTFILIPREIWMLCQLCHNNIVSLYDWYEGVDHYQMVMPKHGVGMDLFEFIDRSPLLDEVLVSYIFRQLANAVAYLHDLMISHRDIKDENIILDDVFKIKLIDFGAAIKVEPDQKFKTFCGTMEFCSPEILLGQEYNCFHADIWSMGITLYTIMFGENPFYDFEETINAVLKPPKIVSTDLFQLLSMLLEPNPLNRITAQNLSNHHWLNQEVNITQYSFEDIVPNSDFCGNMASDFRKYSIDSNCATKKKKSAHISRKKESIKQESY